jgi:ADP-ribosylglycohydrolase
MVIAVCGKKLKDTPYETHFKSYKDILERNILSCDQSRLSAGSGYVPSAAIWCCLNNNTFVDTVNAAASFDKQRDSIACITGIMAGLFYREDGILAYQVSNIPDKKLVDSLIERYLTFILKGCSGCL